MKVTSAFQDVIHVVRLTKLKEQTCYLSRELTTIVKALADQITSTGTNPERSSSMNREGNTHDAVVRDTLFDSDM